MSQWSLNEKCKVLPQQTVRNLTNLEFQSETERTKREEFDKVIRENLGDSTHKSPEAIDLDEEIFETEEYKIPDANIFSNYDKFIDA